MRVHKAIVLFAVATVLVWGLGATDEPTRVGVVDLERAVIATDEGRTARDEFERKAREAEATLRPMVESYEEMGKELEAKRFVLSEDALFQKRMDIAELRNQIETKQKEIQGQLELDRERLLNPLRLKLEGIIKDLGTSEGFTLIFQKGTPGLLYSREALDVTDLLIEKFNKKG